MNRTRVTEERPPQAAPAARAARTDRSGAGSRTAIGGRAASTAGRCAPHGHG
ncbi:hypothetical protein ACFXJO_00375 [Streptomyces lavendulae]|uniref:hypothetical protein n=1 Tax=Streptomyces TaxID=1883 RepID=UPI0024745A93|nr:hypothetical protein [Streptomyces sp. SPB4]MDH6538069.1 hypothetical protein [Streptomyces sp. SPB4]